MAVIAFAVACLVVEFDVAARDAAVGSVPHAVSTAPAVTADIATTAPRMNRIKAHASAAADRATVIFVNVRVKDRHYLSFRLKQSVSNPAMPSAAPSTFPVREASTLLQTGYSSTVKGLP